MGQGIEIVLGYAGPEWAEKLQDLHLPNIKLVDDEEVVALTSDGPAGTSYLVDDVRHELHETIELCLLAFPDELDRADTAAIRKLKNYLYQYQHTVDTTTREFPFHLSLYWDSDMGDTFETAVIGVPLSGYSRWIFLDWKDQRGFNLLEISQDLLVQIEIARDALVKELPWMREARVFIKECHY